MKRKNLFFPLLMAIVMVAMNPAKVWADDVTISDGSIATLKAAFDAAAESSDPVTIKLESDVTGGNWSDPFFTLTGGTITLDLNDHKIAPQTNTTIKVAGADLTVVDNGANKSGLIKGLEFNSGTLQLCGGTISNKLFVTKSNATLADILGEGCYFTDTNGNTIKPTGTGEWKTYVVKKESAITEDEAKISVTINGETKYFTDFSAAFLKAAKGTTETPASMKLLKDVSATDGNGNYYCTFTSGVITLDLNDHKLETNLNYAFSVEGGNLTIVDNGVNKNGLIKGIRYNSGTLQLYGGTITTVISVTQFSDWANILGKGCKFVKSNGDEYIPDQYNPSVWNTPLTVVKAPAATLTLDEEATSAVSYDTDTEYDITVNRTMKTGKWNTLCLPFNMTAAEVESNFGEGAELKVIESVTKTDGYFINFADATEITAGEMYIVKPSSSNISTITANEKTPSITSGSKTFGDVTVASPFYRSDIEAANLSSTTSTYILNDDKFYLVDSDIIFKGFRWYVTTPSDAGTSYVKVFANINGVPTEINNISVEDAQNDSMFNLAGQRVNAKAKGIVIKNGKKVFIK